MRLINQYLGFIIIIFFFSTITVIHQYEIIVLTKFLNDLWKNGKNIPTNRWSTYEVEKQTAVNLDSEAKKDLSWCNIPALVNLDDFFNYGRNKAVMTCNNLAEFGGDGRVAENLYPYNVGSRIVCLDEIKKGNCTVLSFGISNDPSFDFEFHLVANCSVYMFDPTTSGDSFPLFQKMKFFDLGLGGKREQLGVVGNKPVMVDRYEFILKMLNLTDKVIDYLKVDIEGYEISFLEDVLTSSPNLLKNAKQIALEIHPGFLKPKVPFRETVKPVWKIMHHLECLGFRLISFVPNLYGGCSFEYNNRNVSGCFDIVYRQYSLN